MGIVQTSCYLSESVFVPVTIDMIYKQSELACYSVVRPALSVLAQDTAYLFDPNPIFSHND